MRSRLTVVLGALAITACGLFPDLGGLAGDASVDDGSVNDASVDGSAVDAPITDASDAEASAFDSGDARVQDNTTIFCGPVLACSHADPSLGCCVSTLDAGLPPDSYVYSCTDKTSCTSDSGASSFIACDQRSDCPGGQNVCCWSNLPYPIHTFCFQPDAGNCAIELCDPNDPVPCVNHAGYSCVPSGTNVPNNHTTPLGYFVCVP